MPAAPAPGTAATSSGGRHGDCRARCFPPGRSPHLQIHADSRLRAPHDDPCGNGNASVNGRDRSRGSRHRRRKTHPTHQARAGYGSHSCRHWFAQIRQTPCGGFDANRCCAAPRLRLPAHASGGAYERSAPHHRSVSRPGPGANASSWAPLPRHSQCVCCATWWRCWHGASGDALP